MANTIVQSTLAGGGKDRMIVRHIHLVSDGTQETNTVIFQNSSFAVNPTGGALQRVMCGGGSVVAPGKVSVKLLWDATTKVPIVSLGPTADFSDVNFYPIIGHPNPATAGATGNILLTTTGLAVGDEFFLTLYIIQARVQNN